MNILKRPSLLMAFSFMIILGGLTISDDCLAGGGVNWKVTIDNPTAYKVEVHVYTRKNVAETVLTTGSIDVERCATLKIAPGASQTAECGAKCPVYLSGHIPLDSLFRFTETY